MKEQILMTVTCFNKENQIKEQRLECDSLIGAARLMLAYVPPRGYTAVGYFVSVEEGLV